MSEDEFEDESIICPYGEATCDQDDWESMCEDCKSDRAQDHHEGMMDTYD